MFKKILIALIVALFGSSSIFAQVVTLNKAVDALTQGEIRRATEYIDEATLNPETANLPETWYYRIYIYKALYNSEQQSDRFSAARDESINALRYFLTLDNREQFEPSALKMGKFIASTYYNDAVKDLNGEYFEYASTNYNKYKEAYSLIDPTKEFGQQDLQFQLSLASGFMELYESDRIGNAKYFESAKVTYENVLKEYPENWNANYNLGILIYNKAVSIIKSMDYGTELSKVSDIQAECIKLFFTSLPYMQKAHELNPAMSEPIAGLTGIYFSLYDQEQYTYYKNMLSGDRH